MLRSWKRALSSLVAVALALSLASVCRAGDEDICRICGMYIQRFIRTAATVELDSGKRESYCGVACAVRSVNEAGGLEAIRSAQVTSWGSGERIPMEDAVYVVGSRLIPDMLPNLIAFASREKATEFMAKQGGEIRPLERLLADTSYRGLTAPFRITPAAVPSQDVLMTGVSYVHRKMDGLLRGSEEISRAQGLAASPQVPANMEMDMEMLGIGYGLTQDVFTQLSIPYASKDMSGVMRNGATQSASTDGFGDIALNTRWRFWHDTAYDRHLAVLAGITLPSADYRWALRRQASVQEGTGAFALTPGLLYSHHAGDFWFHAAATYTFNGENADEYRFGNAFKGGVAIHWLPNTADLLGLEIDAENTLANEWLGVAQANSGRRATYASLVYQRRVGFCWGGNMNVNALFGVPIREDVNGIQLGEQNHGLIGLQWQRRY